MRCLTTTKKRITETSDSWCSGAAIAATASFGAQTQSVTSSCISATASAAGRDAVAGHNLTYEVGTDRNGKPCAVLVRLEGQEEAPQKAPAGLFDAGAVSGAALADWLTRDQK